MERIHSLPSSPPQDREELEITFKSICWFDPVGTNAGLRLAPELLSLWRVAVSISEAGHSDTVIPEYSAFQA